MNYLAHLYFAKDNSHSVVGNLMGDFMKGVNIVSLPKATANGIHTHRMIDKFTDNHHLVRQLKPLLSDKRRRFSGLISDVAFDHFLAKHWQRFHHLSLEQFCQQVYLHLRNYPHPLPGRMPHVVRSMINDDWLGGYHDMVLTGRAIDSMSKRIRFKNTLAGAIEEVERHYQQFEHNFLAFFPELCRHVNQQNQEQ
ncbi:acyl carrier protein phosphodiesterase [Thalassotalea sp. Y01]|uniref:acyl carrier protein phosphodiesterase n=1 Tax=Thalassotalea sp. Y01 TaxID=2729613 RepID=UPI00145D4CC7|nr:acyl carrier protein phosphodiesterase [Thalassotalea sp. Y01]NMP17727.1 DUF479 domain-containing protein [Thalassotalea sp. Y01]